MKLITSFLYHHPISPRGIVESALLVQWLACDLPVVVIRVRVPGGAQFLLTFLTLLIHPTL